MKKILDRYRKLPIQVRAALWFLVCTFMQRGVAVITTPVFTRIMASQEYGQYGAFESWLEIVTVLVTLRMPFGVYTQGLVKYSEDRNRYASAMQGLSLVLCLAWTVVYVLFHDFFNNLLHLTTVQVLAMMVIIWSSTAFQFWAAEQRVQYKYLGLVAATALISVLMPLIEILCVVFAKDKVTARILGLALADLIGYTGLFFVQMRRGKQFFSGHYWKHALMLNIPLVPHYLSQTVLNSSDRIMIKQMIGPAEAGVYTLAYSVSKVMTMFNQALTQTISPWVYQKIKAKNVDDIKDVGYPAMIGVACLNLILIAFAPEVVAVFAPPSYQKAIWVIPPVAMSVFFIFSYGLFSTFEFYFEKTGFIMIASVFGAALNVALNYIFIQIFGYYAAGYTTLFCYFVYAAGHYCFMRLICKRYLNGVVVYELKALAGITTAFLTCGMILLFSYYHPAIRYSLIAALFAVVIWKRQTLLKYLQTLIKIRKEKGPRQNGKNKI